MPLVSNPVVSDSTDPHERPMLAVAALALTVFCVALNVHVFAALAPFLGDAAGLGDDQIGFLIAAPGVAGAAGALLLGPLVDRRGRRGPLLFGTWVFALASAAYLWAPSFEWLVAVRIVTGLTGGGIVFTSASAAAADLVDYSRRGRAMALITAGLFLAIPVGMPLAVAFATSGNWRGVFWVQLAVGVLAALVMARSLPKSLAEPLKSVGQLTVLRQPMVLPALLSVALYTGAFFSSVQFVGRWLDEVGVLAAESQWWLWIGLGLGSAVGTVALGGLVDRFGKRFWVLWTTAAVGLLLFLLRSVDGMGTLVAVGAPLAIVAASRSSALMAFVSELVPTNMRGTLMGVRAAAVNLGMGGAAAIAGAVIESDGYQTWLLWSVGMIVAAFLLVMLFVREPKS